MSAQRSEFARDKLTPKSRLLKEEDIYLSTINELAKSHKEAKELLKAELERYKLNNKVLNQIKTLVQSSLEHYIKALQAGRFYRRLAVEFNLKKKFIELIEFLDEDYQKEACYYFAQEIEQSLGRTSQLDHYSIEDYLLKSAKPKLNSKLHEIDPSLEIAITNNTLSPFQNEITQAFHLSVEDNSPIKTCSRKLLRLVAFIDIKMHKAFLKLVQEQSASFSCSPMTFSIASN